MRMPLVANTGLAALLCSDSLPFSTSSKPRPPLDPHWIESTQSAKLCPIHHFGNVLFAKKKTKNKKTQMPKLCEYVSFSLSKIPVYFSLQKKAEDKNPEAVCSEITSCCQNSIVTIQSCCFFQVLSTFFVSPPVAD